MRLRALSGTVSCASSSFAEGRETFGGVVIVTSNIRERRIRRTYSARQLVGTIRLGARLLTRSAPLGRRKDAGNTPRPFASKRGQACGLIRSALRSPPLVPRLAAWLSLTQKLKSSSAAAIAHPVVSSVAISSPRSARREVKLIRLARSACSP